MKFRKEYQTYLLIVIAIIIAGYFLKHFFFNKKKKVIEGQAGTTTTYYRVAFSSTDLLKTSATTSTDDQDLLKELILMEYDASKIITDDTDTTGSKYVKPDVKYASVIELIPATLLIKDAAGAVLGLKVVSICGRLEYFKEKAAAAADTAAATAAAAAYDYARLILSNEKAYNGNVTIMAGIAAANLLTIIGQPEYNEAVVTTAKTAALNAYNTASAFAGLGFSAGAAANAAEAAAEPDIEAAARDAAKAAGYAKNTKAATNATFQSEENYFETTDTSNANYIKVMTKYNNDPANLKAAFITAAGLIYQSVYTSLGGA